MSEQLDTMIRDHMQNGFSEAQRIIQFQDVKASSVLGFTTLVFTSAGGVTGWLLASEVEAGVTFISLAGDVADWILFVGGVLAAGMILNWIKCIRRCHDCIRPRTPRNGFYVPNLLFPFHDQAKPEEIETLQARYDALRDSTTEQAAVQMIVEDYKDQAKQLGRIQFEKIKAVRLAIPYMFRQLYFTLGYLLLLLIARLSAAG